MPLYITWETADPSFYEVIDADSVEEAVELAFIDFFESDDVISIVEMAPNARQFKMGVKEIRTVSSIEPDEDPANFFLVDDTKPTKKAKVKK